MLSSEMELRRSVLSYLLGENTFYEANISIQERIKDLITKCDPLIVASLAIEAREKFNLRHIPLFMVRELARNSKRLSNPSIISSTLNHIIQRPDEITKFLEIYWGEDDDKKSPLSAQVKKGISKAFNKFNEYQLAKWNSNYSKIKLRDAIFLTHVKPSTMEKGHIFAKMVNKEYFPKSTKSGFPVSDFYGNYFPLSQPDTWEVRLSSGENKKDVFTDLLTNNKLGALALIKNLRNMITANVDKDLIINALQKMNTEKILPFRYFSAFRYVTDEMIIRELENAMLKSIKMYNKLNGNTLLLVDVSGSMNWPISSKSEVRRSEVASSVAILLNEICDNCNIYSFSNKCVEIDNKIKGLKLINAITYSQNNSGTYLISALNEIKKLDFDRLIIITDEQSSDGNKFPSLKSKNNYIVNIAPYKTNLIYGDNFTTINGFSESIIDFIYEYEKEEKNGWTTLLNEYIIKWSKID